MIRALEVGPIAVCADETAVSRFVAATRASASTVPATFAITWLALAQVRAAILSLAQPDEVAVHEEQTFDLHAPLAANGTYELRVRLERTHDPARIVIASSVAHEGSPVMAMRTALRLVTATQLAAPSRVPQVEQ